MMADLANYQNFSYIFFSRNFRNAFDFICEMTDSYAPLLLNFVFFFLILVVAVVVVSFSFYLSFLVLFYLLSYLMYVFRLYVSGTHSLSNTIEAPHKIKVSKYSQDEMKWHDMNRTEKRIKKNPKYMYIYIYNNNNNISRYKNVGIRMYDRRLHMLCRWLTNALLNSVWLSYFVYSKAHYIAVWFLLSFFSSNENFYISFFNDTQKNEWNINI